jgi:uncharacterized protein YdeI (YjbR/CyaY-like superfamily)
MTRQPRATEPEPTFFATPADFRRWLERHHRSESVLLVGFYKKDSGRPSVTWPESVAEALCFGWIDGVRRRVDDESYSIRFTPRKPGSTWSKVNLEKTRELIESGRMRPAGLRALEERDPENSGTYSYEQRDAARLSPEAEARFRADTEAWSFFQSQPPGYRKTATFWVVSAKRAETRARRLETLIEDSASRRRIGPLRREGRP